MMFDLPIAHRCDFRAIFVVIVKEIVHSVCGTPHLIFIGIGKPGDVIVRTTQRRQRIFLIETSGGGQVFMNLKQFGPVSVRCSIVPFPFQREHVFLIVVAVRGSGDSELLQIVDAGNRMRLFPRLVQRRQKHCRQNRDDRNHDEELYQGENPCFQPAK